MGKITVKHYLNKQLNPLLRPHLEPKENGDVTFTKGSLETYPIYIMAVHNRKVKRFKSKIFTSMSLSGSYIDHVHRGLRTVESLNHGFINEDDYNYLLKNDSEFNRFLEYEKKVVVDALKDEEEGKDVQGIKGFSSRFDTYISPMFEYINGACHQEFWASGRDLDDKICGNYFAYTGNDFRETYEALKHFCTNEDGSFTPFFKYKEEESKHVITFYELYKEYTSDFPFISEYHFEKEGHLGGFFQMIIDKNLPEKIYKGCEMFMHYYLDANPKFFDYLDPLHPMHNAE